MQPEPQTRAEGDLLGPHRILGEHDMWPVGTSRTAHSRTHSLPGAKKSGCSGKLRLYAMSSRRLRSWASVEPWRLASR